MASQVQQGVACGLYVHDLSVQNKASQLALEKPGIEVDDSGVGQLLLQAALQIIGYLPYLSAPLLLFLNCCKATSAIRPKFEDLC